MKGMSNSNSNSTCSYSFSSEYVRLKMIRIISSQIIKSKPINCYDNCHNY